MGRMEDVELVEVGVAPEADQPDVPGVRLAPLLRRWWPVPVAAVLAVVGVGVALDARQEAELARLRETESVITTTVEPPLEVVEWGTPETISVLYDPVRTADGLLIGSATPEPGRPAAVVALDPETGAERWRVDVAGDPGETGAGLDCEGDGEPARTAWCFLLDGQGRQLVAVDLERRSIRSTRALPDGVAVRVSGDRLFTARQTAGGVEVVASGLTDGTEQWLTRVPEPEPEQGDGQQPGMWVDGAHLWVYRGGDAWVLDPVDGSVLANGTDVVDTRGGRLVAGGASAVPRLLGTDGGTNAALPGTPLMIYPDDGSAPGVLVLQGADGVRQVVRGVDARTGETLWQRPPSPQTRPVAVVLDGVVYGTDPGVLWAVDLETGAERWSSQTVSNGAFSVMTDGVHLLQVEITPDGDELVAYDLHDGTRAWSEPLPDDIDWVQELGGMLVGSAPDGTVRVLR